MITAHLALRVALFVVFVIIVLHDHGMIRVHNKVNGPTVKVKTDG
jgi:hypothetical protein